MAPVKHVKETHTFSTGVDKPAYVTAVVTLPMTAGFEAAEADAMKLWALVILTLYSSGSDPALLKVLTRSFQ